MFTDLLPGHGVCSCAEIDDGATIEAGKNKVKSGTPDRGWEDAISDEVQESYLARPRERPRRKMTTLSYSLVVFRVKKRETGKVTTTTRKESSSRIRERPFKDEDDNKMKMLRMAKRRTKKRETCLRRFRLRRPFCHLLLARSPVCSKPKPLLRARDIQLDLSRLAGHRIRLDHPGRLIVQLLQCGLHHGLNPHPAPPSINMAFARQDGHLNKTSRSDF